MSGSDAIQIDVKKILSDKNPAVARLIPGFLVNYLRKVIHEDELNDFFGSNRDLMDVNLVRAGIKYLGVEYTVHNSENIPGPGRYIFTSNHPLGGLDGGVFVLELSKYFKHVRFPVNDILMNVKNMSGIFLPVNKHGAQDREAVRQIEEAYSSDSQILYFPAGLCSRKKHGEISDLVWQKSIVVKAVRHKRDIVSVYFAGRNSDFFYNLANFRVALGIKSNFEMLYLVDEMFRQRDKQIHIVFGETIPWQTFDRSKTPLEWAAWLKEKTYDLASKVKL